MQFVIIGFPAFVALTGAILVGLAIWSYQKSGARYAAASSWAWTTGRIEKSWLKSVSSATNSGALVATATYFTPCVEFTYQAGGVERRGTKPFVIMQNMMMRDEANRWLASVPSGATVPVIYDPADLNDAALTLNPPQRLMIIWLGVVGIAMIIAALPIYQALQP